MTTTTAHPPRKVFDWRLDEAKVHERAKRAMLSKPYELRPVISERKSVYSAGTYSFVAWGLFSDGVLWAWTRRHGATVRLVHEELEYFRPATEQDLADMEATRQRLRAQHAAGKADV